MNRKLFQSIKQMRQPKHLHLCYLWTNGIGYTHMRAYPYNKWGIGYWRRRVEQKHVDTRRISP